MSNFYLILVSHAFRNYNVSETSTVKVKIFKWDFYINVKKILITQYQGLK